MQLIYKKKKEHLEIVFFSLIKEVLEVQLVVEVLKGVMEQLC